MTTTNSKLEAAKELAIETLRLAKSNLEQVQEWRNQRAAALAEAEIALARAKSDVGTAALLVDLTNE